MGNELITYVREKKILFMGSGADKQTVELLRKVYQERGGPQTIQEVRDLLDANDKLRCILEDGGLNWPDSDADVTGQDGFFDTMGEDTAAKVVKYLDTLEL